MRRRGAIFVEREMLDVDAVIRQKEIRKILAAVACGCRMLISGLVLEVDAVLGQEVRDSELFDALDQFPVQGAQLDEGDPVVSPGAMGVLVGVGVSSGQRRRRG